MKERVEVPIFEKNAEASGNIFMQNRMVLKDLNVSIYSNYMIGVCPQILIM